MEVISQEAEADSEFKANPDYIDFQANLNMHKKSANSLWSVFPYLTFTSKLTDALKLPTYKRYKKPIQPLF